MHFRQFVLFSILFIFNDTLIAQCPPNLDFEEGTFNHWNFRNGITKVVNYQNVIQYTGTQQIPGRQDIIAANPFPGYDYYGNFPKSCPNGSNYSIKLGDDIGKHQAEGVYYTFTIPDSTPRFSLIYHYALVFQDPGHASYEQPRLQIQVINLTDFDTVACPSFSFVATSNLPGFILSPRSTAEKKYYYKDWSANTIKLDNMQGKTILISFTTADCVFEEHFGYAYFDIETECNGNLPGSSYCPGDTSLDIKAPVGYQSYKWFNNNYSLLLSSSENYHVAPPPPTGTNLKLELTPFNGYGCKDTLLVPIRNDLNLSAFAGTDKAICNGDSVQLGTVPQANLNYHWSPATGLSNPDIANPRAFPATDMDYTLTVSSKGGGCTNSNTVKVYRRNISKNINFTGDNPYCTSNTNAPQLHVDHADQVEWYRNDTLITGSIGPDFSPLENGFYKAALTYNVCNGTVFSDSVLINIEIAKSPVRYPDVEVPINFPMPLDSREISNQVTWSPASQLSDAHSAKPLFKGDHSQLYTIDFTTRSGCHVVDTLFVKSVRKTGIYVPSVFAPESGSRNNHLRPLLFGFAKVNYFRIYNRWGKLLYSANNDYPGWDGRTNGMLEEMQTVVWMIDAVDLSGKRYQQKGSTILLR